MSLEFNIVELVYKFTFHGGYWGQRVEGHKMLRLKKNVAPTVYALSLLQNHLASWVGPSCPSINQVKIGGIFWKHFSTAQQGAGGGRRGNPTTGGAIR